MIEPEPTEQSTRPDPSLGESWSLRAEPSRRLVPRGRVLVAVGVALAVAVGLVAYQLVRPKDQALALSLAFTKGETTRYQLQMTMDGTIDAETLGITGQPMTMELSETLSWTVKSVDADGVATVEIEVEDVSGSVNGMPAPEQPAGLTTEVQIAPDGRILSAGGITFSTPVDSGPSGFPGMGQMTPLLPDHPVAPGDAWDKEFTQEVPFGKGELRYTTHSTFERYEEVRGTRTAVISTDVDLPLDFTISFGELLASLGGDSLGPEAKQLAKAEIVYGGGGSFSMTSWMDVGTGEMVKNSSSGTFDMTMRFSGVPDLPEDGEFRMEATFTQDLRRL